MGRRFPSVYACSSDGREKQVVVSDVGGTILRSSNTLPYYMLMAWEAPFGLARFAALLLLSPVAWLLYTLVSESAAIKLLTWVTFVNVKMSDIESVAQTVLPKFYVEDVHPEAWRVMSSFSHRYLLTASPRVMVEPFAKQYLGVDEVLGTELAIDPSSKRATGFVCSPGVLVGHRKEAALRKRFGDHPPDVGLGDRESDYPFLAACKEGYLLAPSLKTIALSPDKLSQPLVLHDGRLVVKPTPFSALLILLWLPFGVVIGALRLLACSLLPMSISSTVMSYLGVRLIVNRSPPSRIQSKTGKNGVFVCTHRTLMDPIMVSAALKRPITAVTDSLSLVSEIILPIPTVRLSSDRERDATLMKEILKKGDLVVCPEGTTCREPFLLQFSTLFAELSDCLVPVATKCHVSMFHATTARGWEGLADSFYYFMNPFPCYEVTFLEQLPLSLTCAGGKSPLEVADYVQNLLASTLNFQSTNLTCRDKYKALAGKNRAIAQ